MVLALLVHALSVFLRYSLLIHAALRLKYSHFPLAAGVVIVVAAGAAARSAAAACALLGFLAFPWLVKSQEVIILKTLPLRAIQTKA